MRNILIAILFCLTAGTLFAERPASRKLYYDYTARQPWIGCDTVLEGPDWSLPDWVEPAPNSCIVTNLKTTDATFPGNKTLKFNLTWRQLEPREGVYEFQRYLDTLDAWQARGIRSVELHVRGGVWCTNYYNKDKEGKYQVIRSTPGSAPQWLRKYGVKIKNEFLMTNVSVPFRVVNCNVYDDQYQRFYHNFIRKVGASGLFDHPIVRVAYINFDTNHTRGEEGNGPDRKSCDHAKFIRTMQVWADALGDNKKKCMSVVGWSGDNLIEVLEMGFGQRNGFIEMYLAQVDNPLLGMSVDDKGYIIVDEEYPAIREQRAWGDENEEYDAEFIPRFGPVETFHHRYIQSSLMALVMRRNSIWEQNGGVTLDPYFTAFMGLELGRTVENTPDIWCCLRESYIRRRTNKDITPVKNFERWLTQRDAAGAGTKPTRKVVHGTEGILPNNLYNFYVRGKEYDYMARMGKKIGLHIDSRFLEKYKGGYAIKITFYDRGDFEVNYYTHEGPEIRTVHGSNDGRQKTATLMVGPLANAKRGFDLTIAAKQNVEISFVRIIKCLK